MHPSGRSRPRRPPSGAPETLRTLDGAGRFRAQLPEDELELVPSEARDLTQPARVYWAVQDQDQDPFLAGAYWGLAWSLTLVFGDTIGSLLESLTLSNVERWNGSQWVPLA